MQTIHIPKTAFRANIRGYTRQPGKGLDPCLWRELIQNSRDAGATRVDCSLEQTDSHIILTFADNGKGMDWDTLEKGMLTYGGSVKDFGAAGGFGMAKLVVCFSSDQTIITTRDHKVRIDGIEWEKLDSASYLNGTELVISCPKGGEPDVSLEPTEEGLRFLLARCDLRGMKVYFNGTLIFDCRHDKADEFKVIEFPSFKGTAYYYKRRKPFTSPDGSSVAILTHRGIWVCDFPLPGDVKGAVLIDSDADPKKALNDTRTSLSDYWQKRELEQWIGKINQGAHSTLKTKKFTRRYDGGLFIAEKVKAAEDVVKNILAEVTSTTVGYDTPTTIAKGEMSEVMLTAAVKMAEMVKDNPEAAERITARLTAYATGLQGEYQSTRDLAQAVRTLAWEPALMVVNEREQAVPKKFLPDGMTPAAKKLLRVWTEAIRQFLLWQGEYRPFGVGFVFSDDTAAQFKRESDGTIWFLVNPCDEQGRISRKISNKAHLRALTIDAAHEAAHAAVDDGTIHGDSFVSALERNLSKAMEFKGKLDKVIAGARKS